MNRSDCKPFPPDWNFLSESWREPGRLGEALENDLEATQEILERERTIAFFCRLLARDPCFSLLSARARDFVFKQRARYKGSYALQRLELETLLEMLSSRGIRPVLLKGSDLTLRYYEEPYLRAMSDIDLLLPMLEEADLAVQLLVQRGYRGKNIPSHQNPWEWDSHAPALVSPSTLIPVEIHGALIFPPRDRRHIRTRALLGGIQELQVGGFLVRCLCPEANVVFLFAHAIKRHEAESPRFLVLLDVCQILLGEGGRFDWDRLIEMSKQTGFIHEVRQGLDWLRVFTPLPLPSKIEDWALQNGNEPGDLSKGGARTREALAGIWYSGGAGSAVRHVYGAVFPPCRYMRQRYPKQGHWPALLLYPYRWADQTGKLLRLGLEFARRAIWQRQSTSGGDADEK